MQTFLSPSDIPTSLANKVQELKGEYPQYIIEVFEAPAPTADHLVIEPAAAHGVFASTVRANLSFAEQHIHLPPELPYTSYLLQIADRTLATNNTNFPLLEFTVSSGIGDNEQPFVLSTSRKYGGQVMRHVCSTPHTLLKNIDLTESKFVSFLTKANKIQFVEEEAETY